MHDWLYQKRTLLSQYTRSWIGRASPAYWFSASGSSPGCKLTAIGKVQQPLWHWKSGLNKKGNWMIVLPRRLLKSPIKWFHIVTGHPGDKNVIAFTIDIFNQELRRCPKHCAWSLLRLHIHSLEKDMNHCRKEILAHRHLYLPRSSCDFNWFAPLTIGSTKVK